MKRFLVQFISSWWLSPLGLLLCAGLWCCDIVFAAFLKTFDPPMVLKILWMVGAGGIIVFLALCLAAFVRALVLKRWGRAVAVFFATGACVGVSLVAACAMVVVLVDNDDFADDLSVPEGIEIAEPGECTLWLGTGRADGADAYFTAVSNALSQAGTDEPTVSADVPSFARLARENRDILLRYLSAHPGWRVFALRDSLYATRIMKGHGGWDYPLNGFFSDFHYPMTAEGRGPHYQVRLTIGFPDPWWNRDPRPTRLAPGETADVVLSQGMATSKDAMYESHVIISAENACIETLIDEESAGRERRLTKALLRLLEEELRPLAESPTPATIARILPPGAILRGEAPDISLKDGMQGGIYAVRILANPGEPGLVYLKAFEVTKNTPLSQARLPGTSSLRLGWSDDPGELYSGTTEITIYEGNWGQFYAARFELWFKPDSGAPERKLAEKVFRIQGWQR